MATLGGQSTITTSEPAQVVERKLCWRITRVCNLHCQHCLAGHANRFIGELTRPERFAALGAMSRANVRRITWTGGEPTLCDDLPELLHLCHFHKICSVLTTHGLSIKEELWKTLDAKVDRVRVSFDGLTLTHNRIRRAPVFAKALRSLARCASIGVGEANVSVLRQNIDEIPDLLPLLIDNGASKIVLLTLMMRESAADNKVLPPEQHQIEALRQRIQMLADRHANVTIQLNDYSVIDDKYIVVESNGDIMLCSESTGDAYCGSIVGPGGQRQLDLTFKGQTLSHRALPIHR